jgi:hypothetical protein
MSLFESEEAEVEYLKLFFDGMRRTGFNPDEPLTWEYGIRDADLKKLENLARHLESLQYRVTDLFEDDVPSDGSLAGEYILGVEKVDKHTPETLTKRRAELMRLASEFGLTSEFTYSVRGEGDIL